MTHVTRRRHVAALVFATTCGFLAGMAIMAVLTLVFGGEPFRPAASSPAAAARVVPPPIDARPAMNVPPQAKVAVPDATHADAPARPDEPPDLDDAVEDLRRRRLDVPIGTIERDKLRSNFSEARGGTRRHEAMDLLAPRHTPVVAVEAGIIARLFNSKAGGITIYQFDPTTTYAYYYAHLERYAPGLVEGATVSRGQVIGYVGTSGNAPENTPHLHFAIFVLDEDKRWWQGTPVDPFDVLR
jgi:murein DD-endopeptidase MepM/ murein hydrolase activator NlpD